MYRSYFLVVVIFFFYFFSPLLLNSITLSVRICALSRCSVHHRAITLFLVRTGYLVQKEEKKEKKNNNANNGKVKEKELHTHNTQLCVFLSLFRPHERLGVVLQSIAHNARGMCSVSCHFLIYLSKEKSRNDGMPATIIIEQQFSFLSSFFSLCKFCLFVPNQKFQLKIRCIFVVTSKSPSFILCARCDS